MTPSSYIAESYGDNTPDGDNMPSWPAAPDPTLSGSSSTKLTDHPGIHISLLTFGDDLSCHLSCISIGGRWKQGFVSYKWAYANADRGLPYADEWIRSDDIWYWMGKQHACHQSSHDCYLIKRVNSFK
jgi:hypothetical protein